MRFPRIDSHILIVIAFSVFALAPLTAPGYFIYGHDARHSVYFLQMFDQSFRDGAWYPRWAADMVFGYGYPLWIILAPIPFFAGELVHLAGLNFVDAVKMVDGLAVLFSALTMYLFASRVLNRNAGLLAAVAYVYIPYHVVDLYVRAAQAELVSFVFPPLALWSFFELARTRRTRYVFLGALAYAGLLLTHIQTAVLFTPVLGIYILCLLILSTVSPDRLRFILQAAGSLILALGLSALFLLPALVERNYLTSEPLIGGAFDYQKHFVNISQLLSPFWGYGYAGENGTDQFSLQLGLVAVLLALTTLWALIKTRGSTRWHIALFLVLTAGIVVAMVPVSVALWKPLAGIMAYVQFPWRMLGMTAIGLAFLSGAAVYAFEAESQDGPLGLLPALALVLVFVLSTYPYTEPQHTDAVFNYQTQMDFEVKDGELLGDTVWMEPGKRPTDSPLVPEYRSGQPLVKAVALDGGATVKTLRHGGQSDEIQVQGNAPARVLFYTRYFPGWTATLDGTTIPVKPYGEQGLIVVDVPAGAHSVLLRFEDTPIRQMGLYVSVGALVITILGLVYTRAREGS